MFSALIYSQLSSKREGANDTLDVVEHTGGTLKWGRIEAPKTLPSSSSSSLSSPDYLDGGDHDGPMGWVRDDEEGARFDVKTENKVYSFVPCSVNAPPPHTPQLPLHSRRGVYRGSPAASLPPSRPQSFSNRHSEGE